MIEDIDEALRQLLLRELPVKDGEVDIQFYQPKREWSARLSRPTLNVFLYDVRENLKLRHTAAGWELERGDDGTSRQRRRPFRTDLHYVITAWVKEPEDEHRLLSRTLMALFRVPEIPQDLLPPALQGQPAPIPLKVAQYDTGTNLSDLWSAMDNELRPAIVCVVTVAVNPYEAVPGPLVRTRELRVGQAGKPGLERIGEGIAANQPDTYWTIGGTVYTEHPLEKLHLSLVPNVPEDGMPLLEPALRVALTPASLPLFSVDYRLCQTELERGVLSPELRKRFDDSRLDLSSSVSVTTVTKGEEWHIKDNAQGKTYKVERGIDTLGVYQPGARFTAGNLRAGRYTMEIRVDGGEPRLEIIVVPAPDCVIRI
jgi:hypothetical protein